MGIKRKQHSAEFKARVAMAALSGEKTLAELSAEFGVHPTMIRDWKQELVNRAGELFARAKTFFKSADSGNRVVHAFCPDCGTPIYSAVPDEPPSYSLRVGTLDRRGELVPARQIWWRSALPWTSDLNLPGAKRLDRQ